MSLIKRPESIGQAHRIMVQLQGKIDELKTELKGEQERVVDLERQLKRALR